MESEANDQCVMQCNAQQPSDACVDCELMRGRCRDLCPSSSLENLGFGQLLGLSCWPGEDEPNEDCEASGATRLASDIRSVSNNSTGGVQFTNTATVVSVDPLTFATSDHGQWALQRSSTKLIVGEVVELTVNQTCPFYCTSSFTVFSGSTLRMAGWRTQEPPAIPGLNIQTMRSDCRGQQLEDYARGIDVDLYVNQTRIRPGAQTDVAGYTVFNGVSADLYVLVATDVPMEWRSGLIEEL